MLTKWKDNLFNSFTAILTKRDNEGVSSEQWHKHDTQKPQYLVWADTGLALICRGLLVTFDCSSGRARCAAFNGKETCQLRKPAWQRRHIRGNTSPDVGTPLSFSKAQSRGGSGGSSKSTCSICMGESLNAWYKIKKREEMNTASFIAC